jgi:hypothetical protein
MVTQREKKQVNPEGSLLNTHRVLCLLLFSSSYTLKLKIGFSS